MVLVAGLIGFFRRSIAGAVLVGTWLAAFMLIKGTSVADVYAGSFFRYMAPAFPAAFLLVLALPFLIPIAGRRLAKHGDLETWPVTRRSRRLVAGVLAFLAIAPLVPILAFDQQQGASAATLAASSLFIPASTFPLQSSVHGGTVTLSWPAQDAGGSRVEYGIQRSVHRSAPVLPAGRRVGALRHASGRARHDP